MTPSVSHTIPLTIEGVMSWRLRQHGIIDRYPAAAMTQIIDRIGGVQAQVMSAAELQIAARVEDVRREDVARTLWTERQLVKSWLLRGTLHLSGIDGYPRLLGALRPFAEGRRAAWYRSYKTTPQEMSALLAGVRAALSDRGISRLDLAEAILAQTGNPGLRDHLLNGWGSMLKPSSYLGDLCFGENDGQNVTFVSPRAWLRTELAIADADSARLDLARAFLAAYAPTTAAEFGRWSGVGTAAAKKLFAALGDALAPVTVDGWAAVAPADAVNAMRTVDPPRGVRLLPLFDPLTIAISQQPGIVPTQHRGKVYRVAGWISPVVIADGRIVGTWNHTIAKRNGRIIVTIHPFSALPKRFDRGIAAEVARYAAFLGGEAQIISA